MDGDGEDMGTHGNLYKHEKALPWRGDDRLSERMHTRPRLSSDAHEDAVAASRPPCTLRTNTVGRIMNREQSHSERGSEMCREWSMSKGYSSATKDLGREDKHAHTNSARGLTRHSSRVARTLILPVI